MIRRSFQLHVALLALLALTVLSGQKPVAAPAPAPAEVSLLNASYDVTRELYKDVNAAFSADWKKRTGQTVNIRQSHAGSTAQVRAVVEGLEADVVTLNQVMDIDTISKSQLISPGWAKELPNESVPFTSTILFVVRKGNPKNIRDWADLIRPGIAPIIPNPKTSGNGRYSYLAAWAYATKRNPENEASARDYLKALFSAVPVLDTGGRGATMTFADREIGDVLLTFENEAKFITSRPDAKFEVVVPSVSILAENPVAIVHKVAAKRGSSALAKSYLTFLFSPAVQEIGARHSFRPTDPAVLARHADKFPKLSLVSVKALGGWRALQAKHFADGGLFDAIYSKH